MRLPFLLGDIETVIQIILIILFIVFPLIGQMIKGAQGNKQPEKKRPPARRQPAPDRPPRPQAKAQGGPQDALRNEIDEFLQRASRQRGAEPLQDVEILEPEVVDTPPPPRRLAEAFETRRSPLRPTGGQQPPTVQAPELAQPKQQLAAKIGLADEKVEGRLQQLFDHKLGSLADTSQASPHDEAEIAEGTDADVWATEIPWDETQGPRPAGRAQQVAAMLRDPSGLRDAIILSEIFRRPDQAM
jgi:hypothetical protein